MATSNCRNCPDTYTISTARSSPAVISLPKQTYVCPTCGGLECLCRPRFFDGQLLSADDLTRLERYIIGKNRLHNRYLHGWGVVCGLEVVCDPCKDTVTVRSGYALSPCGDDIVVCKDISVPVCDLIKQCQRASADDCFSSQLTDEEKGCQDAVVPWVLSICYDEKPSRGINPLQASSGQACCSKCACGGSSTCGCSCHEKTAPASPTSSRYAPAQCEPSIQCEGFRFTVTRASPQSSGLEKRRKGEMTQRFNNCLQELISVYPEPPEDALDLDQQHEYCCQMLEATRDFFSTHSTFDCQLDEKLAAISCPRRNARTDAEYKPLLEAAWEQLIEVHFIYWQHCLCSALLPPCPETEDENCVPLALIKIQRNGCHVISACNLSVRRFATTFPSLSYWLSSAPIGDLLKAALAQACCTPFQPPKNEEQTPAPGSVGTLSQANNTNFIGNNSNNAPNFVNNQTYSEYTQTNAQMTNNGETMSTKTNGISKSAKEIFQVYTRAWNSRSEKFDPKTLVMDFMGMKDKNGQPFLAAEERRNPLATLLANRIAAPVAGKFLPGDLADLTRLTRKGPASAGTTEDGKARQNAAGRQAAASTAAEDTVSRTELETLKRQVETLKRAVDEYRRKFDSLSDPKAKKG